MCKTEKELKEAIKELDALCPPLFFGRVEIPNYSEDVQEENNELEICKSCGFVTKDCQCKNEETKQKLKLKTKILFGLSWILNKISLGLQYTINKVRDAYNYIYSKALEDEVLVDRLYKKNTNTTNYRIKNGGVL